MFESAVLLLRAKENARLVRTPASDYAVVEEIPEKSLVIYLGVFEHSNTYWLFLYEGRLMWNGFSTASYSLLSETRRAELTAQILSRFEKVV